MAETTFITTQIRSDSEDFDIRREFCGVQDKRLNDLRQFSSCIIDLQTHGAKDPFEKVTWMISHYDETVRAFVIKRIQSWAQTTQIAALMHAEDLLFHQQMSSDSSSGSIDVKVQQFGNSVKSSSSPPSSSVPLMFKKTCKTPSHDHHFGSVPNAALVPQTDTRSRYQHGRRRRNSSSSSSSVCRPALFGKPSDGFFTRKKEYSQNRCTPLSTPITKIKTNESIKLFNENSFPLVQPFHSKIETEYSWDSDGKQTEEHHLNDAKYDSTNYEGKARWANLLSDTSDTESRSHPLMADIIAVSQLRDCLLASHISSTDHFKHIQSITTKSCLITTDEKFKKLNNEPLWFYRLILNSKIILSNGIHQCKEEAEILAWNKMVELMTHKQGVELKMIGDGRCKIALRKVIPSKQLDETTTIDADMNTTTNVY